MEQIKKEFSQQRLETARLSKDFLNLINLFPTFPADKLHLINYWMNNLRYVRYLIKELKIASKNIHQLDDAARKLHQHTVSSTTNCEREYFSKLKMIQNYSDEANNIQGQIDANLNKLKELLENLAEEEITRERLKDKCYELKIRLKELKKIKNTGIFTCVLVGILFLLQPEIGVTVAAIAVSSMVKVTKMQCNALKVVKQKTENNVNIMKQNIHAFQCQREKFIERTELLYLQLPEYENSLIPTKAALTALSNDKEILNEIMKMTNMLISTLAKWINFLISAKPKIQRILDNSEFRDHTFKNSLNDFKVFYANSVKELQNEAHMLMHFPAPV